MTKASETAGRGHRVTKASETAGRGHRVTKASETADGRHGDKVAGMRSLRVSSQGYWG